uniref:Uncharacterized protein n=1 Tax=uncultured marine virus TaxID=186617 RepID=A0A0F7LA39_9VIRU|nr:hypothetical protein [uncultured marine virus]
MSSMPKTTAITLPTARLQLNSMIADCHQRLLDLPIHYPDTYGQQLAKWNNWLAQGRPHVR